MIQSLKMALKSIAGSKMRAFLTMLGIIIGVMTLVVLVSLVNGATTSVTDTIAELGSNYISVTVNSGYSPAVTMDDLNEWAQAEEIGAIAPEAAGSMTAHYESTSKSVTVYGTTAAYYDVQELQLQVGRFLKTSDVENSTYVCVLSEGAAEDLVGYADCTGTVITLNGVQFTVVGVLQDDDSSLMAAFTSGSDVAYLPYTTMVKVSDSVPSAVSSFYVAASAESTGDEAEEKLTELLNEHFDQNTDAYSLSSSDALEEATSSITAVLEILLGGIAAISLVVGGIGIMNIMLVTVTERTREIGIRKAIGASRGVILLQFLMESVVLCLLGCLIGIFLSWALLRIITAVVSGTGLTFSMQPNVVIVSVIFCVLIGLIFGLYPANKAAKMHPIDALHYGG